MTLLLVSCASTRTNTKLAPEITGEYYRVTKHYDAPSKTWYFLTKIDHKDKSGDLIPLRLELAIKDTGETVRQFAIRKGTMLAFNASTQRRPTPQTKAPSGTQIVAGKIVQELPKNTYTLGIKANNELVAYPPGTSGAGMLQDGSVNALTAFIPLIEGHKNVHDSLLTIVRNFNEIHPRQIIAQFDNLDLLFLSCGGRGFDGEGMTSKDLMRILQNLEVKFAYMLDGGGSTSTVVGKTLITKKIDENGTQERTRPNFLFFMPVQE
ncbi:hypothetical protein GCM10027051_25120 [Niabella terrae]